MIIIQDKQEKKPWDFKFYGHRQKTKYLETADYTLEGYEDILRIERKNSTAELANNCAMKWKAFQNELERLLIFPERYLICEFPESHIFEFPVNSKIPKKIWPKLTIGANFLCSRINLFKDKYGMQVIFAKNRQGAERAALEIFEKVINEYKTTKTMGNR